MNKKTEFAIGALSLGWLLAIILLPANAIGSFTVTLLLSVLVFGKIERDKSRHEREFYFRGSPSESTLAWLRRIANVEIVGRGLLLAATSLLLFQGTEPMRVLTNRASFVVCTVLAFLLIRHLDRRTGLDALRWGYVKMSLIAGIVISIPVGFAEPIGLIQTAKELMEATMTGNAGVDEAAEVVNSLSAHLNGAIRLVIQAGAGKFLGFLISAALSTNVVYGFIVVLYASALHQGIKWIRTRLDNPAPV